MIKGIGIHIKVQDFKKSSKFYESLGFQKVFEYGPDKKVKERYNGVTYEHGGARLELADGHVAVKSKTFKERITSSKVSLMLSVESIKKVINRCKIHDIPLRVGPRHYYWGTLEVVLEDPDGVILVFIAPHTIKEAKEINADEVFSVNPVDK